MEIVSDCVTKYLNIKEQIEQKNIVEDNQIYTFNYNKFNSNDVDKLYSNLYNFEYNGINIYNDLEIFVNYSGERDNCIFNIISLTFAVFPEGRALISLPLCILPDTIEPEKPLNLEFGLFTH